MSGTTTPPMEDEFVWFREDRIREAMRRAVNDVVEAHGNKAKAFAWDVTGAFRKYLDEL